MKRLAHRRRDVFRAGDEVVVLGDRQRHAGDVGFLERVGADQLAADLPGDADDRRGVEHRRGDAGDHVRGARTGGRNRDADLPSRAREPVSHVRRALLVAHQHVADGVLRHRVVRGQDRAARVSKHGMHALAGEAFPNDLRSGSFHDFALSFTVHRHRYRDPSIRRCSPRLFAASGAATDRPSSTVATDTANGHGNAVTVYDVTAPCAADDTRRAYFAITPLA